MNSHQEGSCSVDKWSNSTTCQSTRVRSDSGKHVGASAFEGRLRHQVPNIASLLREYYRCPVDHQCVVTSRPMRTPASAAAPAMAMVCTAAPPDADAADAAPGDPQQGHPQARGDQSDDNSGLDGEEHERDHRHSGSDQVRDEHPQRVGAPRTGMSVPVGMVISSLATIHVAATTK
jgi:hypothetical protein